MDQIVAPEKVKSVGACSCGKGCKTNIHHRKPRSIGGVNYGSNLIRLPMCSHKWWHMLVYNLSAQQIAHYISYTNLMNETVVATPTVLGIKDNFVTSRFAHTVGLMPMSSKWDPLVSASAWRAWHLLFSEFGTHTEILSEINRLYLDTEYKLKLVWR